MNEKEILNRGVEDEEFDFPPLPEELGEVHLVFENEEGELYLLVADRKIYLIDEDAEGDTLTFSVKRSAYLREGMFVGKYDPIEGWWAPYEDRLTVTKGFIPVNCETNFTILEPINKTPFVYCEDGGSWIHREDMENLSFSHGNWKRVVYNEDVCLGSNSISHGGRTEFTVVKMATTIVFNYLISSELNYDFFTLTIDGNVVLKISGNTNTWQKFSIDTLTPYKNHTFTFSYFKDGSVVTGADRVIIKDVEWRMWGIGDNANLPESPDGSDYKCAYLDGEAVEVKLITSQKPCLPLVIEGEPGYYAWSSSSEWLEKDFMLYTLVANKWLIDHYEQPTLKVEGGTAVDSNYSIILPTGAWLSNKGNSMEGFPEVSENMKLRNVFGYQNWNGDFLFITSTNRFSLLEETKDERIKWVFSSDKDSPTKDYTTYLYNEGEWLVESEDSIFEFDFKMFFPSVAWGNIELKLPNRELYLYTQTEMTPQILSKRYLVQDGQKLYASDGQEYIQVGGAPATQDDFVYKGNDEIPLHPSSVLSKGAKLLYYSELNREVVDKGFYIHAVPKMQRIYRKVPFVTNWEKDIIEKFKTYSLEQGEGKIYYALSVKEGEFIVYYQGSWERINPYNDDEVRQKGMDATLLSKLTLSELEVLKVESLNLMIFLDKDAIADVAIIRQAHVFYKQEE